MESNTFNKGQWIITEGDIPAYIIYKLKKGKVSIHSKGKKINEVEVKEGETPRLLGILALFNNRKNTASVKTESPVEVEAISLDHLMGLISNEVPQSVKKDVEAAMESLQLIDARDKIQARLAELGKVALKLPSNTKGEVAEVLNEIKDLYEKRTKGK